MNCFDTHYYQLNRKLLLLVGQWPYQSSADRVKRWILYLCLLISLTVTQVAKIITTELEFDIYIEILSNQLLVVLSCIRYFMYTVNSRTIKVLLDAMNANWQSLNDSDEVEIFCETAEEGRLYNLYYLMFVYSVIIPGCLLLFTQPILKYMHLINDSNPRVLLYPAEYFVDQEKYYYLILVHTDLVLFVMLTGVMATDMFFVVFMYHIVGMFKIACHRIEHAFDRCNDKIRHASGRTDVCERIASAVDYHKRAIRFCETLVAAYNWTNILTLLLVVVNITISLYSAIASKGELIKMILGMAFGIGQMMHMLLADVPAQKITDNSREVIQKAYCSLWYKARVKEQTLLLLTMQRGLKPTCVMLGNIYPMALENFAMEAKTAFSYFTVLLSVK